MPDAVLVKAFLKAGVLTELGRLSRSALGTPQGGIISPLLANLALSILDEPFQAAWEATSRYRNQRSYLRSKGVATYRLVRYSDDFVILVNGTREQAEFLRADTAALLARHGLRLSEAKTLITHVDHGFTFLGFRIQRRTRPGKTPCAYTFMSRPMLAATKRKVKALTRRHTLNLSLSELLIAINPVLRGVANYVRHAAVKQTLHYLGYYTWWRVMRWLRAKHPTANWAWFRRRYFGTDGLTEAGVTLFRPDSIPVTRYRYRGTKIATPWNTEQLQHASAAFHRIHDSGTAWNYWSNASPADHTHPHTCGEPGARQRARRFGGRDEETDQSKDQHRASSRPYSHRAHTGSVRTGALRTLSPRSTTTRASRIGGCWRPTSRRVSTTSSTPR